MKVFIVTFALVGVALCRPQNEASPTPIPILSFVNEQTPEGGYSYSYQSADGSFREEYATPVKVDAENVTYEIRGSYSYVAPDGTPIKVVYTSGREGFKAEGAHFPTPPAPLEPSFYYTDRQGLRQKQYNQELFSSRNSASNIGSVFESHKTGVSDLKTSSAYNAAQSAGFNSEAYKAFGQSNVNNVASNLAYSGANSGAYNGQQAVSGANSFNSGAYNSGAYNTGAYKSVVSNTAASNAAAYNEAYKSTSANNAAFNTGAYNEAYKTAALNTAASNTGAYNEAYKTAAVNTAANTGAYNEAYKTAAVNTAAANTAAYYAATNAGAYNTGAYNEAYKTAANTGAYNEAYKTAAVKKCKNESLF
ncbi:uncharacterized protein LOC103512175 [Diaphorina citri]|uniref:Uncharacterized protein LOC103512175 n=1 Tax=Diaphorina citri TaxID=121845 RepID=A0A1S4EEU2_DIACI|nr:uncharacterized protein LOC103512175 [Diaphorina citri]